MPIIKVEQQIAQHISREGRAASDGEKKDGDKDDLQPASAQTMYASLILSNLLY